MIKIVFDTTIEDKDKVTKIDVIDDNCNILESAIIYAEESFDTYMPGIFNSNNSLYSMFQHLYNSARNNEEITFEKRTNGEIDEEEL